MQIPGLVNVDFADVKAIMKNSGTAMLGVGVSSSKNRAQEAAEQATLAPLIGSSIESATGVVYNITGGKDITLQEVNKVSQVTSSTVVPFLKTLFFYTWMVHLFSYSILGLIMFDITYLSFIKKRDQISYCFVILFKCNLLRNEVIPYLLILLYNIPDP